MLSAGGGTGGDDDYSGLTSIETDGTICCDEISWSSCCIICWLACDEGHSGSSTVRRLVDEDEILAEDDVGGCNVSFRHLAIMAFVPVNERFLANKCKQSASTGKLTNCCRYAPKEPSGFLSLAFLR